MKLPSCSTLYKQKIPITKEIFSLYSHQYFRDVSKHSGAGAHKGNILSDTLVSSGHLEGEEEDCGANRRAASVSMAQMKEDKNLKWLAEIYARNEARRQLSSAQDISLGPGAVTPKARTNNRYTASNRAESSVILPSSSPSHSVYNRSSAPNSSYAMMQDTTIQSISSSSSNVLKEVKVRLTPQVVEKIRNELFRSTILKLVKDGIIVVFPADLSPKPHGRTLSSESTDVRNQLRSTKIRMKRECENCRTQLQKELERIPPHLMTMDGVPLRQYTASKSAQQACTCPSLVSVPASATTQAQPEETYALLTVDLLLPIVEKIVARMDLQAGIDIEAIWNTVRRTDDMWRFVSRDMVKECLEAI